MQLELRQAPTKFRQQASGRVARYRAELESLGRRLVSSPGGGAGCVSGGCGFLPNRVPHQQLERSCFHESNQTLLRCVTLLNIGLPSIMVVV